MDRTDLFGISLQLVWATGSPVSAVSMCRDVILVQLAVTSSIWIIERQLHDRDQHEVSAVLVGHISEQLVVVAHHAPYSTLSLFSLFS